MNILVCLKRVPLTGGKLTLTPDAQAIDTRMLGFTISPHEECAVEEAVRLAEKYGGSTVVLTLGPESATEQLRDAMAIGIDRAIHLVTGADDGAPEWDPLATADAIADALRADGTPFDLLLFGNEAADTGDYQVGARVAHRLDLPCVTGIKELQVNGRRIAAKRESGGAWEIFELDLPAVVTVKEGLNLPRYPSLPGRLKAKKKPIASFQPARRYGGLEKLRLKLPAEQEHQVEILGRGAEAAPKVVDVLEQLGLL
jgi:electron transfer flavoprotein beta subunit